MPVVSCRSRYDHFVQVKVDFSFIEHLFCAILSLNFKINLLFKSSKRLTCLFRLVTCYFVYVETTLLEQNFHFLVVSDKKITYVFHMKGRLSRLILVDFSRLVGLLFADRPSDLYYVIYDLNRCLTTYHGDSVITCYF